MKMFRQGQWQTNQHSGLFSRLHATQNRMVFAGICKELHIQGKLFVYACFCVLLFHHFFECEIRFEFLWAPTKYA